LAAAIIISVSIAIFSCCTPIIKAFVNIIFKRLIEPAQLLYAAKIALASIISEEAPANASLEWIYSIASFSENPSKS